MTIAIMHRGADNTDNATPATVDVVDGQAIVWCDRHVIGLSVETAQGYDTMHFDIERAYGLIEALAHAAGMAIPENKVFRPRPIVPADYLGAADSLEGSVIVWCDEGIAGLSLDFDSEGLSIHMTHEQAVSLLTAVGEAVRAAKA